MSTTINAGNDYEIHDYTLGGTDTPVVVSSLEKKSCSCLIRSNTEDGIIEVRKNANDTDFFTIPFGQAIVLDFFARQETVCYLRAASGSVDAQVLVQFE